MPDGGRRSLEYQPLSKTFSETHLCKQVIHFAQVTIWVTNMVPLKRRHIVSSCLLYSTSEITQRRDEVETQHCSLPDGRYSSAMTRMYTATSTENDTVHLPQVMSKHLRSIFRNNFCRSYTKQPHRTVDFKGNCLTKRSWYRRITEPTIG